jgi:hypothetical protein
MPAIDKACEACGVPLPPYSGRGRHRKVCVPCARPSLAAKRWREANPRRVDGYNVARRIEHEPKACIKCGWTFTPNRRDRLYCCDGCKYNAPESHRYWHERGAPTPGTWTAADRNATRAEHRQRMARHGVHLPEDSTDV